MRPVITSDLYRIFLRTVGNIAIREVKPTIANIVAESSLTSEEAKWLLACEVNFVINKAFGKVEDE